jgi:hypothetical protein
MHGQLTEVAIELNDRRNASLQVSTCDRILLASPMHGQLTEVAIELNDRCLRYSMQRAVQLSQTTLTLNPSPRAGEGL